jgi:hypothetical protein
VEQYLYSPYILMVWCMIKHRDNFTFYVTMLSVAQTVYDHMVGWLVDELEGMWKEAISYQHFMWRG